ncbi:fatty acid hydroxylase domain-containing protein 2 isoform X1 [Rhipicephalus sanguineus]|uniref:fatty acid hydroxylase domain-containing protein 2 isoform X1 n=1 Tax=Rhipicephalus sanguineus TaxID=34632 RepID=UPI001895FA08|nr:fatty acid hydroxylase domain-containing protein 2 isoform X1 [Rhipicephalus sanguineus]
MLEQQQTVRVAEEPRGLLLSSLKSSVFILGTAFVVLVAGSNTLTWHLQRFWGASGNFWQGQWDAVEAFFDGDEFSMSIWGTFAVTFAVYWVVGGLYTLMDLTGRPAFLLRYKIQDTAPYPVNFSQVWRVVRQVLFNQLVVGLPFGLVAHQLLVWRGYDRSPQLPTFHWVLFELAVCVLVEEAGFYYAHRLLHHPRLYRHIHKQHHEWTAPIAITAVYCHPLEHICSNLLPPLLGVLLLGSHPATAWLWFSVALLSSLNAHSGFHLPFFPSPEAHDYHHLKFNNNFGVLGVLDRLHGTDRQFRQTAAYRRHVMLLSLVPLKDLWPAEGKKSSQ